MQMGEKDEDTFWGTFQVKTSESPVSGAENLGFRSEKFMI